MAHQKKQGAPRRINNTEVNSESIDEDLKLIRTESNAIEDSGSNYDPRELLHSE